MTIRQLGPLYPPFRFGIVEEDVYRGGYPKERNFRFLKRLNLKTILSLTPKELPKQIQDFAKEYNINFVHLKIEKPKENIPLSFGKVVQILMILMDTNNLPLYIHCLDGTTVTGVTVMCLRKLQGWITNSYLAEAMRFLKDESITNEEKEFVQKFTGDFEIPSSLSVKLPKWLWNGGTTFKKHPTLKVRLQTHVQEHTPSTTQPPPLAQSQYLVEMSNMRSSYSVTNLLNVPSSLSTPSNNSRIPSTTDPSMIGAIPLDPEIHVADLWEQRRLDRHSRETEVFEEVDSEQLSRTLMALDLEMGRNQ